MPRSDQGKKPSSGLGKALVNQRSLQKRQKRKQARSGNQNLHVTDAEEANEGKKIQSVTDRNELDEFLVTAMLKDQAFVAEKERVLVLGTDAVVKEKKAIVLTEYEDFQIPRRPKWTKDMSADELDRQEREAFLKWRRAVAEREEAATQGKEITPFEKNLEVWRQLWRVIERSDLVVQIVDSRNPLLFYSKDVEVYIKEVDPRKKSIVLINKADFLSKKARQVWAEYFRLRKIDCVFFSAAASQELLEKEEKERKRQAEQQVIAEAARKQELRLAGHVLPEDLEGDAGSSKRRAGAEGKDKESQDSKDSKEAKASKEAKEGTEGKSAHQQQREARAALDKDEADSPSPILSRDELLKYLIAFAPEHASKRVKEAKARQEKKGSSEHPAGDSGHDRINIGMVGYPNVGKSSTINVLYASKKTQVSATPGKTKHFQTLLLDDDVCICDCPGLVFPTFLNSRADLVLNGIMPIDQLHDYVSPVDKLCELVHPDQLREAYAVSFAEGRQVNSYELLRAHSHMRGFTMDSRGDYSRSARIILKDFVKGQLLFCLPPPGLSEKDVAAFYRTFPFAPPPQALTHQSLSGLLNVPVIQGEKKAVPAPQPVGESKKDASPAAAAATDSVDSKSGPHPVHATVNQNRKVIKPLGEDIDFADAISKVETAYKEPSAAEQKPPKAKDLRRAKQRIRQERREMRKGGRKMRNNEVPIDQVDVRLAGKFMTVGVRRPPVQYQPRVQVTDEDTRQKQSQSAPAGSSSGGKPKRQQQLAEDDDGEEELELSEEEEVAEGDD